MFCKKCGAQLSDRAAFCPRCGTPSRMKQQQVVTAPAERWPMVDKVKHLP